MKKDRPKKNLGQNFLIQERVVEKILSACNLKADESVLEIGPGRGALTRQLLERVREVIAVEKDPDMIRELKSSLIHPALTIHEADILRFPIPENGLPMKVIGNIPYNISSAIIEYLIECRSRWSECYLTVQKEFARRLTACPGTKDYGSFTCFTQFSCVPTLLFTIRPGNFFPAPKVDSAFINLRKIHPRPNVDEKLLFTIIRSAFQQRRKTIVNSLHSGTNEADLPGALAVCGLDPQLRADQISLPQYIKLARALGRPDEREGHD